MPISYRVMKTHEFEDSVFYRVACDCCDEEHDLTLMMEMDKDNILTLSVFGNLECSVWYGNKNWFVRFWGKIKKTIEIWYRGYFSANYEMMIFDEEHLDSFISALQEAKEKFGKED